MTEKREFPDWEERYRDEAVHEMPWYYADLDPDIDRALAEHGLSGPGLEALDLGTGPGTQAIALAGKGFKVTATDVSEAAVEYARKRAVDAGAEVEFLQDDILDTSLDRQFDLVVDRGVFHIFPHKRRRDYLANVAKIVCREGWLFLKCFDEREESKEGPYRFNASQIREYFQPAFDIVSIEESVYQGTLDPLPRALFCVMRRGSRDDHE